MKSNFYVSLTSFLFLFCVFSPQICFETEFVIFVVELVPSTLLLDMRHYEYPYVRVRKKEIIVFRKSLRPS